jgi:hypothetical protein
MSNTFAVGKYAFGFCDRCSFRYDLAELKTLTIKTKNVNIRVCPECWEEDQPQLQLGMYPVFDPQALRNPLPDTSYYQSRSLTLNVLGTYSTVFLGTVTTAIT